MAAAQSRPERAKKAKAKARANAQHLAPVETPTSVLDCSPEGLHRRTAMATWTPMTQL